MFMGDKSLNGVLSLAGKGITQQLKAWNTGKTGVKYLIYFWMLYCKHPPAALVF